MAKQQVEIARRKTGPEDVVSKRSPAGVFTVVSSLMHYSAPVR